MQKFLVYILVLFTSFNTIIAQTKNLTGVVSDTLNIPLENANVIAKPFGANAQLKFAIADNKGRFRLELESSEKYEITVSYIGYQEEVLILEPNSPKTTHNFKLANTGEQLKEIIIKHEFKPIVIKKDTMTFNVKSFVNGNERKMKEVLEKLPGVEVDKKGNVTVQGKKVTKMLVEGKNFFGGGSKLAVENIPADAIDKIEVIDHFNEVGFMKKVSDSEDLAMNVKLKEDKKKFVFGDIEAGAEVAGDKGFFLGHAGLFYYSPKTNLSYIGDSNNVGRSTFTFDDLMRFDGGFSSFLSGRKSFSNLYTLTTDNTDVVLNKSQFSAINFSVDTSPKLALSGYGIFSKTLTATQSESRNKFLQNTLISFENQSQRNRNQAMLGLGNVKLDYSPTSKEKWYYNVQLQSSNNKVTSNINSVTNVNNNLFENLSNADNTNLKQYIEWHKSINDNHTTTLVVNHALDSNKPFNSWFTNQPFLSGLIPLQTDSNYTVEQIKKVKNNSIDALFKHYWILDNFNHLYTVVGNNYGKSNFVTSEKQLLTSGLVNNFETAGFGNNTQYVLNDAYLGFEYKFKIGNLTTKPGLYLHWYQLKTNQNNTNNVLNKNLWQPQFNTEYEFNKSESLTLNYKLTNTFPEVSQLANQFTLQAYNSVFKGNALLENEQFHATSLRYTKMNLYRGITINANASFNKKTKTTRNEVEINGINQFTTPILTNNPETTWRMMSSVTKKIYRFNVKLNTNLNWFNYIQKVNNITSNYDRNNQQLGLSLKTAYRKWPDFSIGYTKGFNQIKGITESGFKTDEFKVSFEKSILKSWTFEIEYENLTNTNFANQTNFYDVANTSLRYHKKNSAISFELFANNFLNNKAKNVNSISDFVVSEQTTFILPRVVMLLVSYKL